MTLSPTLTDGTYHFPSELDILRITDITLPAVSVRVTLGTQILIETTLIPFGQKAFGEVALDNVAQLITDALIPDSTAETTANLTLRVYAEGNVIGQCTILPLRMRMGTTTAAETIRLHFLTPASAGIKIVPPTAVETLTWIIPDNYDPSIPQDTLTLRATWYNPTLRQVQITTPAPITAQSIHPTTDTSSLYITATIPFATLSPPAEGWQLVSLEAQAAARTITYHIAPQWLTLCTDITPIRFLNAYGAHDTFYFYGTRALEAKPTYTAATILGTTRNYQIDYQPEWKATTGPLNATSTALLHHLLQSLRLWSLTDGEELTLTAADFKPTNELHTPQSATITYREARPGQRLTPTPLHHTFDGTFDTTYL